MNREAALAEIKKPKSIENVLLAMRFMAKTGTVSDVSTLMPHASGNNQIIKKLAIDAICSIIKESLITRFGDLTAEMRQKLAAIMQTLDPKIIDEIGKDLFCSDDARRLSALQMLGILKRHPRVEEFLTKLLRDKDPKIKATAISLMGKMMGSNDQQMVISLLSDPDARVRANTVEALEYLRFQRSIPLLTRYRKEPNNRIRGNVLKALYKLGYTDIEEDLIEMLNAPEPLQKASALWVISQIKFQSQRVEDACGACLLYTDNVVRKNAKSALNILATPRSKGYLRYLGEIVKG
ncbi:MAG: HEAT repeat domain-containing protein [Chitinispirillales bacterium]|jgi:HEAT repeat protein|nr:HEAT repeat domain-containing protein [Chitinispirillales bacterium]